jgi:hypothetical protein
MNIEQLQDVRQGHVFDRHGCRGIALQETLAAGVSYLFLDVEPLLSTEEFHHLK